MQADVKTINVKLDDLTLKEARVVTTFENLDLANDSLSPSQVQYERIFRKVGGVTPGANHTVLVTAENDKGDSQSASRTWTD